MRRAGYRVKRGPIPDPATEAAKEFRKPAKFKMPAGFKHAFEKAQGVNCMPVLSQAISDEGIVMRPYGPVVIRHGVVTGLARADGANTPS